jgi:alpha-L-arabinofuranosidase
MKRHVSIFNMQIINTLIKCVFVLFSSSLKAQTFHVNTDYVLNKIPPFGYNMITANHGFGIIGEDGDFDPDMLNVLVKMELPILRFPGGTYGNLYEWKRAIGPKENRGGMHGWKYIPDDNWFGPDEAAQLMEQTKGKLTILVNFNQGAQYAADWVEYMNAEVGDNPNGGIDWAQVRANNGHPEPYNVMTWEIANEGGNSRIWPRWPYDGDAEIDQLAFDDPVFRDLVVYGGIRTYKNQKLVRDNAWEDSYIVTMGAAKEDFQVRWYPLVRESFNLKLGADSVSAVSWIMVDNFDNSGATDLHYTLNEETGEVIFGDGINGAIPDADQYVYVDYTTQNLDGHVQIYKAMKAVDPDIIISEAFFFLSEYENNDPDNVKADGTQHHMGGVTMGKFDQYYEDDVFKNAVGAATGSFPSQLDKDMSNYENNNGRPANFFLTEYSIIDNTFVNDVQHARTITSAIYFALLNYAIAERGDRIQMANINYLSNHGDQKEAAMPEGVPLVHAHGINTEMYSKYFGDQLVSTLSENIPMQTYTYDPLTWGTTSETHDIPKLYCHSSIDSFKNEAYIMVINTTPDETLTASISGEGSNFQLNKLKYIKELSSISLEAVNSTSNPDNISISDKVLPSVINESISWDFPAASVTSFVFVLNTSPSSLIPSVSSRFGVVDVNQKYGITSYKFELSNPNERIAGVDIYNIAGIVIYNNSYSLLSDSHMVINMPDSLGKGIYIMRIQTNCKSYTQKIFKF